MDPAPVAAADDALGQPTRVRLFALLRELRRPATTGELAASLGLHPSGVRVHLGRLEAAGLVSRARERRPRGRPRDAWTIATDARPGGEGPTASAEMGRWLARATPTGAASLRRLERVGREIGREIAPDHAPVGGPALQPVLAALGFQPRTTVGPGRRVSHCLGNCPYRDAVRVNQAAVCALHRGMTRGLLDALLPGARLSAFVPADPDEAGCRIELDRVSLPAQA